MKNKYRSDALTAIHQTMEALYEIGGIEEQTMREFDASCLTTVQVLTPEEMKAIRLREKNDRSHAPASLPHP
jgi:putative transcriptional regulator